MHSWKRVYLVGNTQCQGLCSTPALKKLPNPKETRPKADQNDDEDDALIRLEVFEAKVL